MQTQELQLIQLTQDSANVKAKIAASKDPAEVSRLTALDTELQSKIAATNGTITTLRGQVAALTDAASGGSGAGLPPAANATPPTVGSDIKPDTLVSPDPSYAKPISSGLLTDTYKTHLNSTASNFGQPRLHASQFLDNFVQMQYEIVAKQLTTLRDEVGRGQRVVFLELPTAIEAGAPLLSLRLRLAVPTRESTAAPKTRETPSQQPLHAIAAGSPILQQGGFWRTAVPRPLNGS